MNCSQVTMSSCGSKPFVACAVRGWAIERMGPSGPDKVVTFERDSVPGITGTFRPQGVAVGRDGTIYAITDGGGGTNDKALVSIARDGTVTPLIVN